VVVNWECVVVVVVVAGDVTSFSPTFGDVR